MMQCVRAVPFPVSEWTGPAVVETLAPTSMKRGNPVYPGRACWGLGVLSPGVTWPVCTMDSAWAASPALKFVSSETAGTPVLARQVLKRSSHGPAATSLVERWTCDEAALGRAGSVATTAAPRSATVRRRLAADLRAASAIVAKTCFEVPATPGTTPKGTRILRRRPR